MNNKSNKFSKNVVAGFYKSMVANICAIPFYVMIMCFPHILTDKSTGAGIVFITALPFFIAPLRIFIISFVESIISIINYCINKDEIKEKGFTIRTVMHYLNIVNIIMFLTIIIYIMY